jgi:hypothetical protein
MCNEKLYYVFNIYYYHNIEYIYVNDIQVVFDVMINDQLRS